MTMNYSFFELSKQKIGLFIASILAFYEPVWFLFLSVFMFVFLDLITGVYRSIKKYGTESFTSKRLRDTVAKLLIYQMCVFTVFPIDHYLFSPFIAHWAAPHMLTKLIGLFIIYTEAVSIKENIEQAFNINFYSKLKDLFRATKEIKQEISDIKGDKES